MPAFLKVLDPWGNELHREIIGARETSEAIADVVDALSCDATIEVWSAYAVLPSEKRRSVDVRNGVLAEGVDA